MKLSKIKDKRFCYSCQSTKTYLNQWYNHSNWYCKKRNNVLFNNPRRIWFKGKQIILKENPRKGICKVCRRETKTHLHHQKYDQINPLKDTIELCLSCHCKESWKLGVFC